MNARPSVSRVRMIARPRQTPHRLGRLAERRVLWHFRLRGWRVLARNWRPRAARNRGGELDLVVRRGDCVVFVEIKARSREQDLDSVLAPAQRRSIERAASEFLARATALRMFRCVLIWCMWRGGGCGITETRGVRGTEFAARRVLDLTLERQRR